MDLLTFISKYEDSDKLIMNYLNQSDIIRFSECNRYTYMNSYIKILYLYNDVSVETIISILSRNKYLKSLICSVKDKYLRIPKRLLQNIDYINITINRKHVIDELKKSMNITDETFLNIMIGENEINTEYKIELLIISKIICIPINVYNEYQNFIFGFNDGKISKETKNAMNLQYFYYGNKYPSTISCIYNI